jgi:hypothetical protein
VSVASTRGGLAVEWIWTDDLVRGLMAEHADVPPDALRWIDTPVAIRYMDDGDVPHRLARLLGLDVAMPESAPALTLTRQHCACAEEDRAVAAGSAG